MISNGPSRSFTRNQLKHGSKSYVSIIGKNNLIKRPAGWKNALPKGKISGIDISHEQIILSRRKPRRILLCNGMEWE